jgi:hypothetical protein
MKFLKFESPKSEQSSEVFSKFSRRNFNHYKLELIVASYGVLYPICNKQKRKNIIKNN